MTIDILTKIYNQWGNQNKINNLGSADEELMWRPNLTEKQSKWLEKFIKIWDKLQNQERIKYENR